MADFKRGAPSCVGPDLPLLTKADVREPANPSALVSQTTTLFAKVDTTFGNDLTGSAARPA